MKRWEAEREAVENKKRIMHNSFDTNPYIYWSGGDSNFYRKFDGQWYAQNLSELDGWELYEAPKKKKKVKLYSPITVYKSANRYVMDDGWSSDKESFNIPQTIVGWGEIEVEVEE